MDKKTYLQEYEQKTYQPATTAFVTETFAEFEAQKEEWLQKLQTALEAFMENIVKMQKLQPIKAGQIAISILRTGIWEAKPRLRFDCYDAMKESGINLAYQYMDIEWLASHWKEFQDRLTKAVEESGGGRYVRRAQIEQYMSMALDRLLPVIVKSWKYKLMDFDQFAQYQLLQKEEVFILTAGEYMDWQSIMYAEVPQIDIVVNPENQPLMFQNISGKIYRKKEFQDIDLTRSRFTDCEFSKCSFTHVDFRDARFVKCLFRDVTMTEGELYGATFTDCVFQNTSLEQMKQEWGPELLTQHGGEVYKRVEFIRCIRDEKTMEQGGEE